MSGRIVQDRTAFRLQKRKVLVVLAFGPLGSSSPDGDQGLRLQLSDTPTQARLTPGLISPALQDCFRFFILIAIGDCKNRTSAMLLAASNSIGYGKN